MYLFLAPLFLKKKQDTICLIVPLLHLLIQWRKTKEQTSLPKEEEKNLILVYNPLWCPLKSKPKMKDN